MINPNDIRTAYTRIKKYIRHTPIIRLASAPFDIAHDTPLSLKLEHLQHTGSFKTRGAFNTLLSKKIPEAGIAAASGGNHGAAVAYAANRLNIKARIFVPQISSPVKIERIRKSGAEVIIQGNSYQEALEACEAYVADTGALSVHAYDAIETITGQGTVGLEWEGDQSDLDTLLIAVGGGGLISGIAAWYQKRVKVVGVEPVGACALHAALEAGRPVPVSIKSIAADSLGAQRAGRLVFEVVRENVSEVCLVTDEAIRTAQKLLWQDLRIATEPGGATAFAGYISGAYKVQPKEKIGILLCGANVDLPTIVLNLLSKFFLSKK